MDNNESLLNMMLRKHQKNKEVMKELDNTTNSIILNVSKMLGEKNE